MKRYWKGLATTESKCGTIDFIHDKTKEQVTIAIYREGEDIPFGLNLNYYEWEELIKLVKRIS